MSLPSPAAFADFTNLSPLVIVMSLSLGCAGSSGSRAPAAPAAPAASTETTSVQMRPPESGSPESVEAEQATAPAPEHVCPLAVPGARVTAETVEGGAALAFTTSGSEDDVRDLRTRVWTMTSHMMMGRLTGPGGGGGRRGWWGEWGREADASASVAAPAITRAVESTPKGVRVIFRPVKGADLEKVRARTRRHASVMASGPCAPQGR